MRLDLIERLIFGVAMLTVVAVGASVAAVSVLFPGGIRSGISDGAVKADQATLDWLQQLRIRKGSGPAFQDFYVPAPKEAGLAKGTDGKPKDAAAFKKAITKVVANTAPSQAPLKKSEAVPHTPWLRQVPGVRYKPRRVVSRLMYQKFQSFQDAFGEAQSGGGEFVETDHGTAYQLNWANKDSQITKLGLQQGDQVLAVNGQPLGKSVGAGKELYERLKGESRFSVLVLRKGNKMVIPVEVSNR